MAKPPKLGPTGDYPLGKLNKGDEGGLNLGVTVKHDRVLIAFGKSVAWIGLDKLTALTLAETIKRRAEELP